MKNSRIFLSAFAACLTGCALAGVDSVNSFFQVSRHSVPAGGEVEVRIVLRDDENKPVTAAKVEVKTSSAAVQVVSAGIPDAKGVCVAKLKCGSAADVDIAVVADGAEVLENLLPNPSFELGSGRIPGYVSTYAHSYDNSAFLWAETGFRSARSLESYAFNPLKSTYWSFVAIRGGNLLHDRRYDISIYAKYDHIAGEYGVTMQTHQTDAADNAIRGSNRYHGRRTGSSGWVRLSVESPVKIMEKAHALHAAGVILAAAGHVQFDAARIRVIPTVRWGQPEASVKVDRPDRCRMFDISFAPALKLTADEYDRLLADMQKALPDSAALKPFIESQTLYHQWLGSGKLAPAEAFAKRLEILKRIEELKEVRKNAADQELENLL